MVARGLDDVLRISRRDFLRMVGLATLSLAGVGFAGCSSKGSRENNVEFKPQNPLQSGYKLIPLPNAPEAPDNVTHDIIEIGKKGFYVYSPGDISCYVRGIDGDIPIEEVKPSMVIFAFADENGYAWFVGKDDSVFDAGCKAFKSQYIKEISQDIGFINGNMGTYGAIEILGVSDNKAYDCLIFIEQGGGKVTPAIYVQDIKNPKNYERYTIHSKEKLDKMMIEIASTHNISEVSKLGRKLGVKPEEWYKIPDEAYRKWPPC